MRQKKKSEFAKNPLEDKILLIFGYSVLGLFVLAIILPMVYIVLASFIDPIVLQNSGLTFDFSKWTLTAYERVMSNAQIWVGFKNALLYSALFTVISVVVTLLAAYPMSRTDFKGRNFFNTIYVITMFFGGGLIPTFLWMNKLGLYDTRWSIILPGMVSMWYIILVRTFFASIPEELRESARIDGANNYQILFNVYVPTSKPIMAVIAIYTIVAQWNSYFAAMVYLTTQSKQPLQLYLRRMLILQQQAAQAADGSSGQGGTSEGAEEAMKMALSADQLKYTIIVVSTLPMLIVYPFLQKYFVKGVMVGSLKG